MIAITGGAGFIGSNLVKSLNDDGTDEILVVDRLGEDEAFANLADLRIADYMDRKHFRKALLEGADLGLSGILHQGACTDTLERNGRYMLDNNFTFSKIVLQYCLAREIPLVYASSAAVYGAGRSFAVDPANERPLNVYGYSKLLFDQHLRHLRRRGLLSGTVVGLRYFNVYGPRERAKGRMASMAWQLYRQARETGVAKLFAGSDGLGDGEQTRDFVWVGDVVKVNRFFLDGPPRQAIVNVGTGRARSFNDLARAACEAAGGGRIEYIPFPRELRGRYQTFTEADLSPLREAGYAEPFAAIEEGVAASAGAWAADAG